MPYPELVLRIVDEIREAVDRGSTPVRLRVHPKTRAAIVGEFAVSTSNGKATIERVEIVDDVTLPFPPFDDENDAYRIDY